MRLISKTALLAAIVSTFACHEAGGPPPVTKDFVLDNIDGRALPTYFTPIPESPTILGSTLHLDGDGHATLVQHVRQMGNVVIQTANYTYTISGNQIAFQYYCGPDANCVAPPHGTISDSGLSLDMSGGGSAGIIYNYRLPYALD